MDIDLVIVTEDGRVTDVFSTQSNINWNVEIVDINVEGKQDIAEKIQDMENIY